MDDLRTLPDGEKAQREARLLERAAAMGGLLRVGQVITPMRNGKAMILTEIDGPPEEIVYACESCHDARWVNTHPDPEKPWVGKPIPCPDCGGSPTRDQILRRCGVPAQVLEQCSLGAFDPSKQPDGNELLRVARDFIAGRLPAWLVLLGSVGRGKTMLALAIMGTLLDRGLTVRFERTVDLLSSLRETFNHHKDEPGRFSETMDFYKSRPVLVLDDMGANRPTEWASETLYDLLDYRYLNRCLSDGTPLLTIITANARLEDFGDDRIASRLRDRRLCSVITLHGVDIRPTLPPQPWGASLEGRA